MRECFSCGKKFRENQASSNRRSVNSVSVSPNWHTYTYNGDELDLPFSDWGEGGEETVMVSPRPDFTVNLADFQRQFLNLTNSQRNRGTI